MNQHIKIWFTNFGWFARNGEEFKTVIEAKAVAAAIGFECAFIDVDGESHGSWSPIGGFTSYCTWGEQS